MKSHHVTLIALSLLALAGCSKKRTRRAEVVECSSISLDAKGTTQCLVQLYHWKPAEAQQVAAAGTNRGIEGASGLAAPTSLGAGATLGADTLIAFATAPGQVALDGEGANSPFSAALSRHIGTPGLEVQQMLTRVRAEVVAATRSKQVPWSNSSLLGEVYLAER